MLARRSFLALSLFFTSAVAFSMGMLHKNVPHSVTEITNEQFDAAVASKKPLFIAYNATWCPVCQKQNQVLSSLIGKYQESALFFTVDWDKKDKFKGPKTNQRTTIAFLKDGKIQSELVGETDASKIDAFIQSNLK